MWWERWGAPSSWGEAHLHRLRELAATEAMVRPVQCWHSAPKPNFPKAARSYEQLLQWCHLQAEPPHPPDPGFVPSPDECWHLHGLLLALGTGAALHKTAQLEAEGCSVGGLCATQGLVVLIEPWRVRIARG